MIISWTLIIGSPRSDRNLGRFTLIEKSSAPRNRAPLPINIARIWANRVTCWLCWFCGLCEVVVAAVFAMARERRRMLVAKPLFPQ